jgi:UDP-2,3-diacylglucosamine hydrolase
LIHFISDLHLSAEHPRTTRIFLDYLSGAARRAERLYILGDLFESWAGDDDLHEPEHRPVVVAMRELADAGVDILVMHGNRDFLLGERFAAASGAVLIADPTPVDLYGQRALLTHGDALCTDDVEYQEFRRMVRDATWQHNFTSQPLATRKAQIAALRSRSREAKAGKAEYIMDVNADAVAALLRSYGLPSLLIHGHTHRPARHALEVDGVRCERIVLGDWGASCSYLACGPEGCETVFL